MQIEGLGKKLAKFLISSALQSRRMDFDLQRVTKPSDNLAPRSIGDRLDFKTATFHGERQNQARPANSFSWMPSKAPLLSTTITSPGVN